MTHAITCSMDARALVSMDAFIHKPTDATRTYVIPTESRIETQHLELRAAAIEYEPRRLVVPAELRTLTIGNEDRIIAAED